MAQDKADDEIEALSKAVNDANMALLHYEKFVKAVDLAGSETVLAMVIGMFAGHDPKAVSHEFMSKVAEARETLTVELGLPRDSVLKTLGITEDEAVSQIQQPHEGH